MVFHPHLTLTTMAGEFRIFVFEESLDEISMRRYKLSAQQPVLTTVFLHACIHRPGKFEPLIEVMIKTITNASQESEILSKNLDRPEIPSTFSSALLGGLLFVVQSTQKNVPLLICSSSDFLSRALVKQRQRFENDLLDPKFRLPRAVFAALNESSTNPIQKNCR
jgi:hypothetical protein